MLPFIHSRPNELLEAAEVPVAAPPIPLRPPNEESGAIWLEPKGLYPVALPNPLVLLVEVLEVVPNKPVKYDDCDDVPSKPLRLSIPSEAAASGIANDEGSVMPNRKLANSPAGVPKPPKVALLLP